MDLELIDKLVGVTVAHSYVSDPNSICLIATSGDSAVGYSCCTSDTYIHQLLDIFIEPELRRLGIGTEMMNSIKMMTFQSSSIEAFVDVSDSISAEFLYSNGFTAVSMNKNTVLMRFGWRFKQAPPVSFRGVKGS